MRKRALVVGAAWLLALVGGSSTPASASGLSGLVTRSPVTPVCQAGTPCSAPAKNVTLVFTKAGIAHSVETGLDGRYRITLAPGLYTVRIASAKFGFGPRTATVPAGRVGVRNFTVDTGIR